MLKMQLTDLPMHVLWAQRANHVSSRRALASALQKRLNCILDDCRLALLGLGQLI